MPTTAMDTPPGTTSSGSGPDSRTTVHGLGPSEADAPIPPRTAAAKADDEIANLLKIAARIRPQSATVQLGPIEIYGESIFLNGAAGGEQIVYLDFDSRYDLARRIERARSQGNHVVAERLQENRDRFGVLLADVSGHQLTDTMVAAMLHQAFLTGVLYELDQFGEVTTRLFENLNTRFYKSFAIEKYITMIYGEISRSGTFRFISAGHPPPLVFSAEFDRFVTIAPDRLVSFFPLGVFPSEDDIDDGKEVAALQYKPRYTVNEVNLMGAGDVLLLYSDGLSEHSREGETYVPRHLERTMREVKHTSARDVFQAIRDQVLAFATRRDDISLVVIKRTR